MNHPSGPAFYAIRAAQDALRRGDRRLARRWAEQAIAIAPEREEPWLILAAVASHHASLVYLKRALEINPHSLRARKGMHWAIQRLRAYPRRSQPQKRHLARPLTTDVVVSRRPVVLSWAIFLLILITGFLVAFSSPPITRVLSANIPLAVAQVSILIASHTPTPTATYTPTLTFTPTSTPTPTPTETPTPTPTETLTPTPTDTPTPTQTATDTPFPTDPPSSIESSEEHPVLPAGVGKKERWIDVNLTTQRAFAFEGTTPVRSFLVSTGTWRYPTVTGQYRIYVKYRYADMSGPGYYLPDVPNVMYFYKGYGLHGTYWHNNFGTPMSHGCVNFTIPESEWLFNFASVGTVVNVHY